MLKLFTVVGARPQFIKAAVVSRVIRGHCQIRFLNISCTRRHFDENMSGIFQQMDVPEQATNWGSLVLDMVL